MVDKNFINLTYNPITKKINIDIEKGMNQKLIPLRFKQSYDLGDLLIDFVELELIEVLENNFDYIFLKDLFIENTNKDIDEFINEMINIHPFLFYLSEPLMEYLEEKNENNFKKKYEQIEERINELINLKTHYYDFVKFCFNNDIPTLNDISIKQRFYLFKKLSNNPANINIEISSEYKIYNSAQNILNKIGSSRLYSNENSFNEIMNLVKNKIDLHKLKDSKVSIEEVYLLNINSLCYFELINIVNNEILIKKCENCNKYFVVKGRTDTKYCNREFISDGKTCNEVGPILKYKRKTEKNQINTLYNKAYKRFYARYKNSRSKFLEWTNKAIKKREDAQEGLISYEEFSDWIAKEDKKYKKSMKK